MKPIYVVVFGAERIGVSSVASRVHYGLRSREVLAKFGRNIKSQLVTDPLALTKHTFVDSVKRAQPDVVIVAGHPYLHQIVGGAPYISHCEFLIEAVGVRLQGSAKHLVVLDTGVGHDGKSASRNQKSWTRALGDLDLLTPADMHLSTIKNVHIDAATYGNHARLFAAGKALDLVLWELSKTPQPAGRTNYGDAA